VVRTPEHQVVIIGSGFVGICAAIKLRRAGIHDFVMLERHGDVGGTWYENHYPGVAVDIPSVTYQFSFAQSSKWKNVYAKGSEVKSYIDELMDKYKLRPQVRFNRNVVGIMWDEEAHLWDVETDDGQRISARFVISAHGVFGHPKMPDIEGINDFQGKIIHTARWDDSHDLTNERVAVIGTGASSVQVVPEIAKTVKQLDVYQRTAIWIFPKGDRRISPRVQAALAHVPLLRRFYRLIVSGFIEIAMVLGVVNNKRLPFLVKRIQKQSLRYLHYQVKDPELRAKLTPTYDFGCKRPSLSDDYWPTFTRTNVDLVTDPIAKVTSNSIVTKDGTTREIDTLILATGFNLFDYGSIPGFAVLGEDGVDVRDWWVEHKFQSYEGLSVPGFPNLFMLPAPFFVTSWSWLVMAESRTDHVVRCITHALDSGATYSAVTPKANDRFVKEMRNKAKETLFLNANCATSNSYYFDRDGDVSFIRPQSSVTAWWRAHHFAHSDYELRTVKAEQLQHV